MSKFKLQFDTDNDVFQDSITYECEVARILRDVADLVLDGHERGALRDVNGNSIGHFECVRG